MNLLPFHCEVTFTLRDSCKGDLIMISPSRPVTSMLWFALHLRARHSSLEMGGTSYEHIVSPQGSFIPAYRAISNLRGAKLDPVATNPMSS